MTHTILAIADPDPVEVIPAWIWLLLIAAGVVASITDLRNTRIPNWLTLPLLAGGLLYASTQGLPAVGHAVAGMVTAGLFLVIAYILMGGGAGDAKLMLAFGSWLGFDASMILMLGVAITGFVQSVTIITFRGGLRDVPIAIFHSFSMLQFAAKQAVGTERPSEASSSLALACWARRRFPPGPLRSIMRAAPAPSIPRASMARRMRSRR
jgi:Flp pilus assembly protein protease CpaA